MGSETSVAVAVALGIGAAIAVQVTLVGRASTATHPLAVSLALQIAGVIVGTIWALRRAAWPELTDLATQWWLVPLGALGWGVVAALGFAAARLGTSRTLALVIAAQLTAGLVIDLLRR